MPTPHSTTTRRHWVRPRLELLDVDAVDVHVPRLALDLLAAPRELVQPSTADLHRRDHRRHLLDVADEAPRGGFDLLARDGHRGAVEHLARGVERAGGDAEPDVGAVRLALDLEEAQQPGEPPETDEQHARRVGVERACVPDAPLAVRLAQLGDDVVGRPPRGLVDDDQPVHHRLALRSHRCLRASGLRLTTRRGSRATTVGMSSSDVKPAAKR